MFWLLAVVVVCVGSVLPASTLHNLHYDRLAPNDKLVHFLGYTTLALIPVVLLEVAGLGVALAASMIPLGIVLEFLQRLIPGRGFEAADMVANACGVATGIVAALVLRRIVSSRAPANP